jgi:hypothetical protein
MTTIPTSAIELIPGPRPSVSFAHALGLVLTDWLTVPIPSVEVSLLDYSIDVNPLVSMIFIPYRLSFNRIGYRVNNVGSGNIQLALYSMNPVNKIFEVSDTFTAVGVRAIPTSQFIEAGIYWLGHRTTSTLPGYPRVQGYSTASLVSLISGQLPAGAYPYVGFLMGLTSLPQTFNPMTITPMGGGTYVCPKMRLYTV